MVETQVRENEGKKQVDECGSLIQHRLQ